MTATTATRFTLCPVTPDDYASLVRLISVLAEYERLTHLARTTPEALATILLGPCPYCRAVLAEVGGRVVGFALFFHNLSIFLCEPSLYLEDLLVEPEYRGLGIGKALLIHLVRLAQKRNYGRFEWNVLGWSASSIAFYEVMGASVLPEQRICRATDDALTKLAATVMPTSLAAPA